jgi:hypothetical protein
MTPIILLPILGWSSFIHIYFNKKTSVSIFFGISFIINILFIFGMCGYLRIGSIALFYGGIFVFLWHIIKYKGKILNFFISVPILIYILASILYFIFFKNAHFFFWDSFSHWGPFVKDMYYFNEFYGIHTNAAHLRYPPGIASWEYFIVSNFVYSEGNVFFAVFLILFSSVLMMYENLEFKDIHWILIIFFIQMTLFASFGHWFVSIYVDHVVGAMAAGLFLVYFVDEFKKDILLYVFPLIAITLVKEIGFYFAVSFMGFWYFRNFIFYKGNLLQKFKSTLKPLGIAVLLIIITFSTLKIWEIRQDNLNIAKSKQSLNSIISSWMSSNKSTLSPNLKSEISKRYWDVVISQQLNKEKLSLKFNEFSYGLMKLFKRKIKLTFVGGIIFVIAMYLIAFFIFKERRKYVTFIYSYKIFVVFVYLIILYGSYLVAFGDSALRIPSYVRYINIAMLPLFFISFSIFLPMFHRNNNIKIALLTSGLTIILILIVRPYFKPLYTPMNNQFATKLEVITKPVLKVVPKGSKIFVVFPIKNNGSLNNMLKYYLIPLNALISKYDFRNKSYQEMLKTYLKYDYVWFLQIDKPLYIKNKQILKLKDKKHVYTLYKINLSGNKLDIKPIL